MRATVAHVSFLAVAATLLAAPDATAGRARVCKVACDAAIEACVAALDTGKPRKAKRRCRTQLLRACRRRGASACEVPVPTTTSTTTTSTTLPPLEVTACPSPEDAAAGTNTAIRVTASQPIDPATVSPSSLRVTSEETTLAGTVEVDGHALTFLPTDPLPPERAIRVEVAPEARDVHGRSLGAQMANWRFVTGDAPVTVPGIAFSEPTSPPLGDVAPWFELVPIGDEALLVWWSGVNGLVATSTDGVSFAPPVTIVSDDPDLALRQFKVAIGGSTIHLVWTYFSNLVPAPGIIAYSQVGIDLTSAATPPVPLGYAAYAPGIAAWSDDDVAITWERDSTVWFPRGGAFTTSNDGGTTFAEPRDIANGTNEPDVLHVGDVLVLTWLASEVGNADTLRIALSRDDGITFEPPVVVASVFRSTIGGPVLVDDRAGGVLVQWTETAYDLVGRSTGVRTRMRRVDLASGEQGPAIEVTAPDLDHACVRTVGSPTGKLALMRSRGRVSDDWTAELRTSDDGGVTFGPVTTMEETGPLVGCPRMVYTASGDILLAWTRLFPKVRGDYRYNTYGVVLSRTRPRRPCE